MAKFELIDGAYRVAETDRKALKEFLIDKIRKTGLKTKDGKLSKGNNFPEIYIGGKKQWFKNKKGIDGFQFSSGEAKGKEATKRTSHTKLSSEHLSKDQLSRWQNKKKKFNLKGLQIDHIYEIQETGPSRETLDKWKAKGWISDAEYNKDLEILQRASGNDPDTNAQGITGKENSQKQSQVAKKNKSLKKLEQANLSNRYKLGRFRGKTFQEIFAFNGDENGNGNGKKVRNGRNRNNGNSLKLNAGGAAAIQLKPNMKPLINVKSLMTTGMRGVANLNPAIKAVDTLNTLTEVATGVNVAERTVHRAMNWDETTKQEQIDMQKRKEEQIQRNEQLKEFFSKTFTNVKSNVRSFRDGPLISTM